ncbi:MAG TPA: DUF1634 domain-containing protein [Terriglobales bacterium]|nr:DUF1634 domain-containing protein [Terriglobales bacterium]
MNDQKLEVLIGNLLRAGVIAAALVVTAGAIVFLLQHSWQPLSFSVFKLEGADLRTVRGICSSAFHGSSEGIMQMGILLLIATPVARVVLAGIGFYSEKDRLYVVVSLVVLAILTFSMMHAT